MLNKEKFSEILKCQGSSDCKAWTLKNKALNINAYNLENYTH